MDFSVAPAWYQTNWFRILCVVFGVFIVWVIYRLRVLQISRAIGASFDERLAERTQMARDLHDTFLQTIQGSKLVADDALVYRIGYEAVRNACMHSGASQLEVELIYARDLALRVNDNGTGIDPDVADRGRTDTLDCKGCGSALLASEASSRSGVLLVLGLRLG